MAPLPDLLGGGGREDGHGGWAKDDVCSVPGHGWTGGGSLSRIQAWRGQIGGEASRLDAWMPRRRWCRKELERRRRRDASGAVEEKNREAVE